MPQPKVSDFRIRGSVPEGLPRGFEAQAAGSRWVLGVCLCVWPKLIAVPAMNNSGNAGILNTVPLNACSMPPVPQEAADQRKAIGGLWWGLRGVGF